MLGPGRSSGRVVQLEGVPGALEDLRVREVPDHRQDRKGTWWMPWHQESKKGVNGCDKPRLGAE